MFGSSGLYTALNWYFFTGFLLPVPVQLLCRRYPNSWAKYIHIPMFISAASHMPSVQPGMHTTWFIVAFIFQFVIYHYCNA
ncbi:hypothetical protein BDF19DRAFT_435370 [Syncephalis fuscata]|nr:hypothetical protein BDF19DRAFT_435370 [Syncephalis fuscata]